MRCCNKHPRRGANRRWIIAFAALLLLTWQSFVVQTHVHAPVPAARTSPGVGAVQAANPAGSDDHDDCPICHEAMRAGHYLTPIAFVVSARIVASFALYVVALSFWPHRHAAHGWYGRGPPSLSTLADR